MEEIKTNDICDGCYNSKICEEKYYKLEEDKENCYEDVWDKTY